MDKFIVSHSVYLTPEERKALGSGPATIETVGISIPMHTDDLSEKLTEVFVRYLVTTEMPNDPSVELMPDGYKISFNNFKECEPILNIKEGGVEWLMLQVDSVVEKDNKLIIVHHQIHFKDISVLEKTTLCGQLGHFLRNMPEKKK